MKVIQNYYLIKKHSTGLFLAIVLLFSFSSVFCQYQFCEPGANINFCVSITGVQTPCTEDITPVLSEVFSTLNQNSISTLLQLPSTKKYAFQQGITYSVHVHLTRPLSVTHVVSSITLSYGEEFNETASLLWNYDDINVQWSADAYFELTPYELNLNPEEFFTNILKFTFSAFNLGGVYKEFGVGAITSGHVIHTEPEWVTVFPEVPQMILRDPPGDGSYSFFEAQSETCHGYGLSIAKDASQGVFAQATLGVSGSVGFIVTTDFEAYASISGSLDMGVQNTGTSETQICFKATAV